MILGIPKESQAFGELVLEDYVKWTKKLSDTGKFP